MIRRGGAPFWCGGNPRSWGCGGRQPPRHPLHTTRIFRPDPEISGKIRITNRRFRKISGSAAQDSQEKTGSRPGNFQKRSPPPPASKKIGHPPSPTSRSEKKLIGPIDFKIGRGGLFYSSATTFASTGVSDETEWSVRSFSKPIGPANFRNGRADIQHTRIRGSPPPPALCSAKKMIGPIISESIAPITIVRKRWGYFHDRFRKKPQLIRLRFYKKTIGSRTSEDSGK